MAVGFKLEGQDLEEIYVKKSEVPFYEGILDLSYITPGGLWAFGSNLWGELGTGNIINRSSPFRVGTLSTWKSVVINDRYTLALRDNGTLWAWGYNGTGSLGTGNLVSRSSPVQVGALTDWKVLGQTRGGHSFAIKTDGSLWAWGENESGQLGNGVITDRSSPIRLGAIFDWLSVTGGTDFSCAVKTDGSLWAWGANAYGQLGTSNVTNRSSPVRVGSLNNWKQVSAGGLFAAAVKTDGTLWTWGANAFGQLGIGIGTIHRSSPVQVGSLTDWSFVQCDWNSVLALKTDGSLWTWGNNAFGKLGLGDDIVRSSPVRVGALNNWAKISCGSEFVAAIKTDGTLWTWGRNTSGQLGHGNTIHRSSPVQVGSLTTWIQVAVGTDEGSTGTECCIGIKY